MNVNRPQWGDGGGPIAPKELAHVTHLGPIVRVWSPREKVYVGAMVILAIGGLMLVIATSVVIASRNPGPLFLFALGLLLGGIAIYNVVRLNGAARSLVVYRDGFAALVGATPRVFAWDEIATIVNDERMISGRRSAYPERRYVVAKANGEAVVLLDAWFENAQALAESIRKHADPILGRPLQEAYDAGETLTFGIVSVSKRHVRIDGRDVAWSETANVVVKDGKLVVTPRDGSPLKARVSKIPNVTVLGALIGVPPNKMDLLYF